MPPLQRNLGVVLSQQAVLSLGHASLCLTFIFGFAGMYQGRVAEVMAEVSTLAGVCGTVIITGGASAGEKGGVGVQGKRVPGGPICC